ncbi:MAG: hypothetical protein ACT4N4_16880, partial [Rhodospirillales bacterium]
MTMGGTASGDMPKGPPRGAGMSGGVSGGGVGAMGGSAAAGASPGGDRGLPPVARAGGDPLAFCLLMLVRLLDRPASLQAMTGGLPLVDGKLTPELFIRAASRAGMNARLAQRRMDQISPLVLPCALLLRGRRA